MIALVAQVTPMDFPVIDWIGLLPVILPAGGAVLLLMLRALLPSSEEISSPGVASTGVMSSGVSGRLPKLAVLDSSWTVVVTVAALFAIIRQWNNVEQYGTIAVFGNQFVSDKFSLFISTVVLVSVALVALVLPRWCQRAGIVGAEIYVLLLLSASGAVVMAGADDLIVLFLGLETLSISLYVMAAMDWRRLQSLEAGIKYFVLGAFSSAFLLYGIALLYGATGTTSLSGVATYLDVNLVLSNGLLMLGLGLLLVGLGFKVAAVPFHAWAPDVYHGAPTPITAYMASGVKAAGFAALVRVFVMALEWQAEDWKPVVFVLACATLVVGSVLAAVQNDVKRLLAYSSISHAGFILVGVQAASADGVSSVLFYLGAYSVIAVGSFTVLAVISDGDEHRTGFDSLSGLSIRCPSLALAFTVLLLAQAGVPFTSGFVAKLSVISAAADARSYWLAVVAMVSAVIAAFAYLRVVVAMYFSSSAELSPTPTVSASVTASALLPESVSVAPSPSGVEPLQKENTPLPVGASVVITLAVVTTLALGIYPDMVDSLAREAASTLLGITP